MDSAEQSKVVRLDCREELDSFTPSRSQGGSIILDLRSLDLSSVILSRLDRLVELLSEEVVGQIWLGREEDEARFMEVRCRVKTALKEKNRYFYKGGVNVVQLSNLRLFRLTFSPSNFITGALKMALGQARSHLPGATRC